MAKYIHKSLIFTLLLFLQTIAIAQNYGTYTVGEIEKTDNPEARQNPKIDKNGNFCALIIVNFEGTNKEGREKFSFDGGSSAGVEKIIKEGAIWLYVSDRATSLNIVHGEFGNKTKRFEPLEAKTTYVLTIKVVEKETVEMVKEVTVTSNPSDANVTIEGIDEFGRTPYSFRRIPRGTYKIILTKDKYKKIEEEIYIDKEHHDFNFSLRQIYGTLTVNSNVSGCEVKIDGEYFAKINGMSQTFNNLVVGTHSVTLKAPGKERKTLSVEIKENKPQTLDFSLAGSWIEYSKLDRNFLNVTYSTSGNIGIMTGAMYASKIGFYTEYQANTSGLRIHPEVSSSQRRFSGGMMVAFNDWWSIYFGPGIINKVSDSTSVYRGAADAGFEFRAGGVSLLAGAEYNGFFGGDKGRFDFKFGLGFSLENEFDDFDPFLSLVYSPSAPVGIMVMWRKNNISFYGQLQTPLFKKSINDGIERERYSLTFGPTFSLTSWLSAYGGIGVGLFRDNAESSFKFGGDLETGLSFHICEAVSLTAGLHRANAFSKKAYTEFEAGIGLSTELMGDAFAGDERTFIEYSGSLTAPFGFMGGIIKNYNVFGFYGRFQTSNPFNIKNAVSPKRWNGYRSSLTLGTIMTVTEWLYWHGGIGIGAYKNFETEKQNIGFEAETGLNLRFWPVELSAGPHFCNIGGGYYLDWNLGLGVALEDEYDFDYFVSGVAMSIKYVYTPGAPLGCELGFIFQSPIGFYFGGQCATDFNRMNFSGGVIVSPTAFVDFQLGIGMGLYTDKISVSSYTTQKVEGIGFDMEAEVNLNLGPFPVSFGAKMCRVGTSSFFIEPILSFGVILNRGLLFF